MVWKIPVAPRVRLMVGHHPYRWLESTWIANAKTWERRIVVLTLVVGLEGIRRAPKPGRHVVKTYFLARSPETVTRCKDGVFWLGRRVKRSVSRWMLHIR